MLYRPSVLRDNNAANIAEKFAQIVIH